MYITIDNQFSVSALFEAGWTKDDYDELIAEYGLTEEEAFWICKGLEEMAERW